MKTYIQDWLGTKLGIIIDLSPENFGRHTKDGRLLAKLLYSHGALPLHVLNSIKPSKDINDCYNNLKQLKPFLEYLEVPVKEEILYEVASGQGTAALHLFYALYLNLSVKDRLFYISAQKERKLTGDNAKRQIKVARVPEKDLESPNVEYESELAVPLIEKQFMIKRHKQNCNEILEKIKCIKENYAKAQEAAKPQLGPIVSRHATSQKLSKHLFEVENTENDLKDFDSKHTPRMGEMNYEQLVELQNQVKSFLPKPVPNFQDAIGFVNSLKQRTRRGILMRTFQEQMQVQLVDELWNSVRMKQEDDFDDLVSKILLKQSQYEKQMCMKMAMMKRQKSVIVQNRRIIGNISTRRIIQKEYDENVNNRMELDAEDAYDVEFERQRQLELHRRMYIEKVRLKFKERLEEAKSILDKLVDIAIRISEFREVYACEIPKHLMKDMKELFFKNHSIFDIVEDIGDIYNISACGDGLVKEQKESEDEPILCDDGNDYGEEGSVHTYGKEQEECQGSEEHDSATAGEFIRQEVLNECDFNDYLYLLGPWMVELLFPNEVEHEVSQAILGYVVHKVLACKYPPVTLPVPAHLKPMAPRAVVQGSNDMSIYGMLSELMALRKILIVRVDDAINFVLRCYKEEQSAVQEIDITFQQATKTALKGKSGTERTKNSSKKRELLKKESNYQRLGSVLESNHKEASTQTPRNIPDDDPLMSQNAEIGKAAFESLGIGDPVPDITIVSAVIAYVASLQDKYDGWILWNYPILYSQASRLESALTGYQILCIDDEMETVEGLEGFGCRTDCQNPNNEDEFAEKRLSRLVPKPEGNTRPSKIESYFTAFVKLRKKNGETSKSSTNVQGHEQDYIEKFYSQQNIYYCFEYVSANFETVKDIGRAILGENNRRNEDFEASGKSSVEIFGDNVLELNDKYCPPNKKMEKEVKKPMEIMGKEKSESEVPSQLQEKNKVIEEENNASDKAETSRKRADSILKDARPGDPNWEWATGPQQEDMLLALATFWEKLEAIFIEDFKFIFFCLRVHRANTVKYKAFMKKALQHFLRREDNKQNILSEFQQKFNDIDDDLRADCDIKCELHVRVIEFEEILLELADERREKSDNYRIQFVNDNWITQEISNLVNLYVRALQLEADRCIDTCQFINDYYLTLQQKVPQENILQKIYAPTLRIGDRNYSDLSTPSRTLPSNNASSLSRTTVGKSGKSTTSRKTKQEKRLTAGGSRSVCSTVQPEVSFLPDGEEAIHEILVSLTFPEEDGTPYHRFFLNVFENLRNNVKDIVEGCISESKKGGGGGGGGTGKTTGAKDKKKTSETRFDGSNQVNAEWTAALEAELSRFLYRVRLIQTRGMADFNDFIWTLLNVLISVYEKIGEIYKKEVFSISECCKVFRCAIEEEVAVQPRLELNVDEFIINQGSLLFPNESEELLTPARTPHFRHEFTIEQLTFMFQKLQYVAPNGEIIKRSFLHILEDLRVMKSEDGKPRLLPIVWDELNPNDLPLIFDQVYQRIEVVNWKDFVIYALGLPCPTDIDILTMRANFRSRDSAGTELISFSDFIDVDFWFEVHRTRFDNSEVKEFLFKMYQVDEEYTNYTALLLAFCKDEDPFVGFVKALALSTGKRILIDEFDRDYFSEEGEPREFCNEEKEEEYTQESVYSNTYSRESRQCERCVRYPCECQDPQEYHSVTQREEEGESYGLYFSLSMDQESYTSDISNDVVKKVLMASYPFFPQLSVLLGCKERFDLTIDRLLKDMCSDGSAVKISKLLKHKFIRQLVTTTNKFKAVDMQNLVKSIVEDKQENICAAIHQVPRQRQQLMAAKMPQLSYSCEICGLEGFNDEAMRAHMMACHLEGTSTCPFCDFSDVSPEEMLDHVNTTHLDYLTPEDELLAFIDDDDRDVRSFSTKMNGWDGTPSNSNKENDHKNNNNYINNINNNNYEGAGSSGGGSEGSPLRRQLNLNLQGSKASPMKHRPKQQCMMCGFSSSSPPELEEHINRQHFDLTSPSFLNVSPGAVSNEYRCPLCIGIFKNSPDLELHVNIEHEDVLSPAKPSGTSSNVDNWSDGCPVCCKSNFRDNQEMLTHIEDHFANGTSPATPDLSSDRLLAKEIDKREKESRRLQEQKEFEMLRAQYGMDNQGNFKEQSITNMQKAVYAGEMSVADYYERQNELKAAEFSGIDDGSSCTKGLIPKIRAISANSVNVLRTYTCTIVDHYASTYGDKGWGCGYRNLQMLISSLLHHTGYNEQLYKPSVLSGGLSNGSNDLSSSRSAMPSLSRLQQHIEWAWKQGFDIQGCDQLGGKLHNTRKWIGATEIVTALSSLRIRCQLVEFYRPTGSDGSHPELFHWVTEYFQRNEEFKPPLYLQHQGHSRTIVGVEQNRDGNSTLLVFDPSHTPEQMNQLKNTSTGQAGMRLIRKNISSMKAHQYQLVAAAGIMDTEREYQQSKLL